MSNAETPAENTGGTTAASAAGALADLPDKTRVHVLAKRLGTSSREVLATLSELGETARSPQSGVAKDVALRVAVALGVVDAEQAGDGEQAGDAERTGGGERTGGAEQAPRSQAEPPAERGERQPGEEQPRADAVSATEGEPTGAGTRTRTAGEAPEEATRPGDQPAAAEPTAPATPTTPATPSTPGTPAESAETPPVHTPVFAAPSPVFLPPEPAKAEPAPARGKPTKGTGEQGGRAAADRDADAEAATTTTEATGTAEAGETAGANQPDADGDTSEGGGRRRRRRGRRGRGRGKGGEDTATDEQQTTGQTSEPAEDTTTAEPGAARNTPAAQAEDTGEQAESESGSKRRRRRRRRKGGDDDTDGTTTTTDDPPNTVVHVRDAKADEKSDTKAQDGVRSVRGSTRLEAKRQRRRDGREAGRRRAPILSESEFLARRESVDRTMVVAERGDSTQIGVLEDGVLVEHFVTSSGSGSIVGNVYLGRVQNVLPSMEAAFIDIGRGRNAVLYAGEVDWDAAGLEGKARKIEQALSTGDNVLVQVTKDPVGHKGARLTTQISLPGRFLVYVPSGGATGISRKLPENERRRLKDILKRIVPSDAGVIIRTASEGISEEELGRDVSRLEAQWEVIKEKADSATGGKKSSAPVLLYEEPDLLVKVVRDLFTEDFVKLEIQGDTAWETIRAYVEHVAPDLLGRVKRYVGTGDVFADYRIDEQLMKALDRKVWLPSGGYLVIDRTEAMTVIDVNTGKFTGSGGNLEETVTRNNLESAEEIVRQLRLRDIGGIIVIDFIDMVLESNRELVLRRLTECLGRDRTRHQVAEVTSLGLVQMTRKRVGTGLLEAFSSTCEHCKGRGVIVSSEPQKGNGHAGGHHGGQQHGSRRSRNKAKAAEAEAARANDQSAQGPTPEQRESVASAVQAMANASKAAGPKAAEAGPGEPGAANGQAPAEQDVAPRQDTRDEQQVKPARETRSARKAKAKAERAEPAEQAAPAGSAEQAAPAEPVRPQAVEEPSVPAPAVRTATRRPRRAASRPAGPPVHAQENG